MMALRQALMQAWNDQGGWGRGLVLAFRPISWLFGALVALRRLAYQLGIYKPQKLPAPLIVVGNVMVGGVGKTPVTMALVQHLTQQGWRVGVLSRGYGRKTSSNNARRAPDIQAVTHQSRAQDVGDEPLLIARSCHVPVFVGADRAAAGRALLQQHPDVQVLVSDDGLQHWQLDRDLELCVFDERGIGNGLLLPAGPLREPWPRLTHTPHVPSLWVQTSGVAMPGHYQVTRHLADHALQADGMQRPLSSWGNTPVQALAGIAKPEAFFFMLRAKGLTLAHTQALPDHADVQHLHIDPTQGDVFCTEKDAVKLWAEHPHAWAVPLHTTLPADLLAAVDQHLAAAQQAKLSSPHGHQTA
jgi:tetraacyldisaccharide 4'-kinase